MFVSHENFENRYSNFTSRNTHVCDRSPQSNAFGYICCLYDVRARKARSRLVYDEPFTFKCNRVTMPWCKPKSFDGNTCGRCCAFTMSIFCYSVPYTLLLLATCVKIYSLGRPMRLCCAFENEIIRINCTSHRREKKMPYTIFL